MKYISVCSGIEAASVAWEPLGWSPLSFSEIEPFPSAVLNYHWPNVPNYGDMTKFRDWPEEVFLNADIIVGGPPCQAFSVAGARRGLDDSRGQITIKYIELIEHADFIRKKNGKPPVIVVFENVPGLLSDKTGAFGCFLGALAGEECELQPSGKKWTNAGCVFGPQRAVAWRILDAQYFGVAQRRRRVFVVASARKGFNPTEVLFEFDGVRRDIAPSRSSGQKTTRSTGDCSQKSGSTVSGKQVFPTLASSMGKKLWLGNQEAFSGDYFVCHGTQDPIIQPVDNNPKLYDAYQHHGWREGETCGTLTVGQNNTIRGDTPVVIHATQDNQSFQLGRNHGQENVVAVLGGLHPNAAMGKNLCPTITQAMGMGGGHIPIVNTYGIPGNWIGRKPENGGNATEPMDNIAPCQTKTDRHAVAYAFDSLSSNSMKSPNPNSGCREVDLAKTLDTTDPNPSKNQGGIGILQSQAFGIQGSMIGRSDTAGPQGSGVSNDVSFTLTKGDRHAVGVLGGLHPNAAVDQDISPTITQAAGMGGGHVPVFNQVSMVRRLTPIECERLQGFPDNWTQIPYRKKPADQCPDGPRYAACGNSMAVPVMQWIGQRIQDNIDGKL